MQPIPLLAISAALILSESAPAAQNRSQPTEKKTGTIVEVQKKGRGRLLVVEIEGQQQTVPVTPRLDLQIVASGDAAFVRPGQFLEAAAVMSNDKLFISNLTIYPAQRGRKLPQGRITKAAAEPGQSTMAYSVSGMVLATRQNQDYPDHLDVALKTAGPSPPLMLEPGFSVTVNSANPELIPPNADAEFEIVPLRGGRFNVVKVTVPLQEPLTAAEFFDADGKPAARDADKDDDSPPEDQAPDALDPQKPQ